MRLRYRTLREATAQQLEGLPLVLKAMKAQGLVEYEGALVGDDLAVLTFALPPSEGPH